MPHRHREVSRVEGFSDAVFAFAITLLVVSLEVPRTFDELVHVMRGFPAFAVSFVLLFQIWRRHYLFFRSYDLEDGTVVVLTGALLFVVLFYVYPLKFLWSVVFAQFGGARVADEMLTVARCRAVRDLRCGGRRDLRHPGGDVLACVRETGRTRVDAYNSTSPA